MYKNFSKIYDSFMEHCDYDQWVKQVYAIFDKYGKTTGNLLDLGCGTGEMLLRFSDRYLCSGLDLSEEMLRIAHKKLKNKDMVLFQGDMVTFDTYGNYDLLVSFFDTINHLTSNEDLVSHLVVVKKHMKEDSLYVFDIIDRAFMNEMFPGGNFVDHRKKMTIIWEHQLEDGIDFIDATYFVKNRTGSYDKLEESYEKKIFSPEELENAIKEAGLKLLEIVVNKEIAGTRQFYVLSNK